ncbi:glycosyltransferase family 2 protein [Orbus sturtevantii]|uniref:glycosyltransferase family 2 protein n=1 Tax=Orbus sturtevantii TaxID=3074109 RepID=UPI00370D9217
MKYLISIIIPVYNAEKYLAATLTSVFNQTYSNMEIIAVNDGSTDQTQKILFDMQKKEPRLHIISQLNQGISAARNTGINHATGDFIAFIDSDDSWDISFLTKMIKRQQETQGNVIYTGNMDLSSKGIQLKTNDFREHANLAGYLTHKSLLHVGCLLIRRKFLNEHQLRFNINLRTGEDILFICTLFCLTDAFSVPEYLYCYTHRDGSIMRGAWTKLDYLNDLLAWQTLEHIIKTTYQNQDRKDVIIFIEAKIIYYKLRLLWILLLAGRYQDIQSLINDKFLTYSPDALSHIPRKYARTRRIIIESGCKPLWVLVKLIYRKKVNLI